MTGKHHHTAPVSGEHIMAEIARIKKVIVLMAYHNDRIMWWDPELLEAIKEFEKEVSQ